MGNDKKHSKKIQTRAEYRRCQVQLKFEIRLDIFNHFFFFFFRKLGQSRFSLTCQIMIEFFTFDKIYIRILQSFSISKDAFIASKKISPIILL